MPSSSARADGRTPGMMRQLTLERAFLSRADGSARWEQDRSVVLAAVYGPRVVPSRKEDPERMFIEVECRPASGMQSVSDRELEHVVRKALSNVIMMEKHPRLGILVVLQIASSDGSLQACAMNAASAAVLDAAIPSRGVLCAATCATVSVHENQSEENTSPLIADPTADEEKNAQTLTTASFCFKGGRSLEDSGGDDTRLTTYTLPNHASPDSEPVVLHCTARGVYQSEEAYVEATVLARDAAVNVFSFLRKQFDGRDQLNRKQSGEILLDAEPESIENRTEELRMALKLQNPGSGGYRKKFGAVEGEPMQE